MHPHGAGKTWMIIFYNLPAMTCIYVFSPQEFLIEGFPRHYSYTGLSIDIWIIFFTLYVLEVLMARFCVCSIFVFWRVSMSSVFLHLIYLRLFSQFGPPTLLFSLALQLCQRLFRKCSCVDALVRHRF